MLVLESSRIEIAVLLNDLAYLKYEASKSSSDVDAILLKQRHLSVAFSLVEKIVKLIASVAEDEGIVFYDFFLACNFVSLSSPLKFRENYILSS